MEMRFTHVIWLAKQLLSNNVIELTFAIIMLKLINKIIKFTAITVFMTLQRLHLLIEVLKYSVTIKKGFMISLLMVLMYISINNSHNRLAYL